MHPCDSKLLYDHLGDQLKMNALNCLHNYKTLNYYMLPWQSIYRKAREVGESWPHNIIRAISTHTKRKESIYQNQPPSNQFSLPHAFSFFASKIRVKLKKPSPISSRSSHRSFSSHIVRTRSSLIPIN